MEKDWILSECALLKIIPFPNNSQSDFFSVKSQQTQFIHFVFKKKDGVVGNGAPQAPLIEQSRIFLKFEKPKHATVHKDKTIFWEKQTNENLNVKYNFPSLSYYILQEINAYSVDLEKMNKPAMYMYFWCRQFLSPKKASSLKNEWTFIKRNQSEPFCNIS